jgi:DNA-binding HxlR family transcriptional regulator
MAEPPDPSQQTCDGLARLDPILTHRMRLGACVLLSSADALSFSRLKELLEATDGNLGAQMRKLEDVRYVTVRKEFRGRKPVSWYALTRTGKRALQSHLDAMERVIRATRV